MKEKISKILMLIAITITSFSNVLNVFAYQTTDNLYQDDNYKFWVAIYDRDGSHMVATQESMIRRASDNSPVYCIQAPIQFNSGSQVNGIIDTNTMASMSGLSVDQVNRIKLIAYYGYGYEGHTDPVWYYATQLLIWSVTNPGYVYAIADGDTSLTPSNRYDSYYNEINSLVDNHSDYPSIANARVDMKAGETKVLTDTYGILSKYYESYEDEHLKLTVNNNNTLSIYAKTGYNGRLFLNSKTNDNPPMIYEGANQLCLGDGDPDHRRFPLSIYATTEVDVSKTYGSQKDGVYRPEQNAKFELINEETKDVLQTITTDIDGKFTLDLNYGTYTLHQIDGKKGYDFINDYTFTIDGSTAKEVMYFKNELHTISSDLEFTKIDAETGEVLSNTTIEIYNADTDELLFTKVTDKDGKVILKKLEAGKYYIKEVKAPTGYLINSEKMYFEVTEDGETIKISMKDQKIKEVSSYNVPDTSTKSLSDTAVYLIIIGIVGVAYVVVSRGQSTNYKDKRDDNDDKNDKE